MKSFKIYQDGELYKGCNGTSVIADSPKHVIDNTQIEFSLNQENDEFEVTLSNLSAHTQYLLNNNRLGVCLIAERTCKNVARWRPTEDNKWRQYQWVARNYHPYSTICTDIYRITSEQIESRVFAVDGFDYHDSKKVNYILRTSSFYEDPYRDTGYVRYRVMLCKLPKYAHADEQIISRADCGAGTRGYKKSENYVELIFDNNES